MIQFNSKDTHLSLEWVSKSYQLSYSIKVLHVRKKLSDVQEEYGANQQQAVPNSLCLKYFSVLSWSCWLVFGVSFSLNIKLPIPLYPLWHSWSSVTYTFSHLLLSLLFHIEKNKRKYLQYLVVTWRKKTTYLSHEKEQKNLNQESRSCAIISFWFLSLTYTCISMHKYFLFF